MSIYKIIQLIQYGLTAAIGVLLVFAGIFSFIPQTLGGILIAFGLINLVPLVIGIIKKENLSLIEFSYPFIFAVLGIVFYFNILDISLLIIITTLSILGVCIGMVFYGIYVIFFKKKIFRGILIGVLGILLAPNVILFLNLNEEYSVIFWIVLGVFLAISNIIYFILELKTKESDNEVSKLKSLETENLSDNETN